MLLEHGHVRPEQYTLARVWNEVNIIRRRVNAKIALETVLMQTVISSVISGKTSVLEKALKELKRG